MSLTPIPTPQQTPEQAFEIIVRNAVNQTRCNPLIAIAILEIVKLDLRDAIHKQQKEQSRIQIVRGSIPNGH